MSKKKVDWKKLFEAFNTMEDFNKLDLEKIDLSEVFDGVPEEPAKMFYYTGLANIDFMTSDFPMQKGLKRKFNFDGRRFHA